MPRKNGTIDQQRNRLKRDYKRGPRVEKVIRGDDALTDTERYINQELAAYLKAMDHSWNYIGDRLGISPNTVKSWFNNDDERSAELRAKVVEIHEDYVNGAIKFLKTTLLELIEMLMDIARTTDDGKLVLDIFKEFADRVGMVRVNKSEAAAVNINKNEEHRQVDITDTTGLVEQLGDAPPELQQAAAAKMEEMMALIKEGTSS